MPKSIWSLEAFRMCSSSATADCFIISNFTNIKVLKVNIYWNKFILVEFTIFWSFEVSKIFELASVNKIFTDNFLRTSIFFASFFSDQPINIRFWAVRMLIIPLIFWSKHICWLQSLIIFNHSIFNFETFSIKSFIFIR